MQRLGGMGGHAGLCGLFPHLKLNTMSSFIKNPSTIEDFKQNVEFQMENVQGWLSVNDYQSALTKAKCLVDALQKIVVAEEKEQITT